MTKPEIKVESLDDNTTRVSVEFEKDHYHVTFGVEGIRNGFDALMDYIVHSQLGFSRNDLWRALAEHNGYGEKSNA